MAEETKPVKKKNPNRLVVDEAANDDNSVVSPNHCFRSPEHTSLTSACPLAISSGTSQS